MSGLGVSSLSAHCIFSYVFLFCDLFSVGRFNNLFVHNPIFIVVIAGSLPRRPATAGESLFKSEVVHVTPLHEICSRNLNCQEDELDAMVQLFLRHSADIEAQDNFGRTPLHYAVRSLDEEMVRILLKAGANPMHKNQTKPCGQTTIDELDNNVGFSSMGTRYRDLRDAQERASDRAEDDRESEFVWTHRDDLRYDIQAKQKRIRILLMRSMPAKDAQDYLEIALTTNPKRLRDFSKFALEYRDPVTRNTALHLAVEKLKRNDFEKVSLLLKLAGEKGDDFFPIGLDNSTRMDIALQDFPNGAVNNISWLNTGMQLLGNSNASVFLFGCDRPQLAEKRSPGESQGKSFLAGHRPIDPFCRDLRDKTIFSFCDLMVRKNLMEYEEQKPRSIRNTFAPSYLEYITSGCAATNLSANVGRNLDEFFNVMLGLFPEVIQMPLVPSECGHPFQMVRSPCDLGYSDF